MDRSRFIRAAVREKLERNGVKTPAQRSSLPGVLPHAAPLVERPEDAAALLREDNAAYEVETLQVVMVNTRRRLIRVERISQGTLDTLLVHPREVFRAAIAAGAAAVILVHNHPSGNPTPSEADIKITHELIRAGFLLIIVVLDHIIMGRATREQPLDFLSMKALGCFDAPVPSAAGAGQRSNSPAEPVGAAGTDARPKPGAAAQIPHPLGNLPPGQPQNSHAGALPGNSRAQPPAPASRGAGRAGKVKMPPEIAEMFHETVERALEEAAKGNHSGARLGLRIASIYQDGYCEVKDEQTVSYSQKAEVSFFLRTALEQAGRMPREQALQYVGGLLLLVGDRPEVADLRLAFVLVNSGGADHREVFPAHGPEVKEAFEECRQRNGQGFSRREKLVSPW